MVVTLCIYEGNDSSLIDESRNKWWAV